MRKIILILALMSFAFSANAEGPIDAQRVYVGGGLGFNSLPGAGSARGFQFFAGYDFAFKLNEDISSALEIGYTDSGKFDQLSTAPKINAAKGLCV